MKEGESKGKGVPISIRGSGFSSSDEAEDFARAVGSYIATIGREIRLDDLESITIATETEYREALLELDRGVKTESSLCPTTEEYATGVAMTPSVIRNGKVKSAMFLRTECVLPLADPENKCFAQALHLLCHECAHVEVTTVFRESFPDFILSPTKNMIEGLKWRVILPCWDEFAVCCICANVGSKAQVLKGYDDTFRHLLQTTRPNMEKMIRAYRWHGDHGQILSQAYDVCGNLMKFGSYLLGTIRGQGLDLDHLQETSRIVNRNWFKDHFMELQEILNEIMDSYGSWSSLVLFERIGMLAEKVVEKNGVFAQGREDGGAEIKVPFTPDTHPMLS